MSTRSNSWTAPKPIEENLYWKYSGICIPVVFSLVIIIIIILFAQQYNSMHICANTILEEQDSKVRYEH